MTRVIFRSHIRFDRSINKFKIYDCSYEFITSTLIHVVTKKRKDNMKRSDLNFLSNLLFLSTGSKNTSMDLSR